MYIKELKIENIKLIREMELHFSRAEELRMWTVFVGENGLCKTSILQAMPSQRGADNANGFQEIIPSLPDRRKKQLDGDNRRGVPVRSSSQRPKNLSGCPPLSSNAWSSSGSRRQNLR